MPGHNENTAKQKNYLYRTLLIATDEYLQTYVECPEGLLYISFIVLFRIWLLTGFSLSELKFLGYGTTYFKKTVPERKLHLCAGIRLNKL